MATAKQSAGVTRGYKTKTQRAAKRKPNALQRVAQTARQGASEIVEMFRDEIAYATIDTLHLVEYVRSEFGRKARTRVNPVVQEWESFVQEHELLHDVGTFAVEQVNAVNVSTFKR